MSKKDRNLEIVKDEPATAPEMREIELTDHQIEMLVGADRGLAIAQERMNLVFKGICAAESIENARIIELAGKKLTVAIVDSA
jgi:hypothetical protein